MKPVKALGLVILSILLVAPSHGQSIQNCLKIVDPGVCQQCRDGFFPAEMGTKCNPCLANCVQCSFDIPCSKCADGFNLSNNQCVKCSPNCLKCDTKGCLECYVRYFRNSNLGCDECGPNCDVCSSVDNCMTCSQGYKRIESGRTSNTEGKLYECRNPILYYGVISFAVVVLLTIALYFVYEYVWKRRQGSETNNFAPKDHLKSSFIDGKENPGVQMSSLPTGYQDRDFKLQPGGQ